MTALLPDVIRDAVHSRSIYAASESFGVVALALLLMLLLELEVLRAARRGHERAMVVQAITVPLLVAVGLTIALRITGLLQ